ncbi:MAG: DUF1846 domain-containing protein [Clostridia bacterium]|nr:DUF1846 domain-containing protein [Clostridia bacterium]
MFIQGFDNDKYLSLQSAKIKERIEMFGGKLYLEFGGKLFDDYHASRVLPGFLPDSKIKMLSSLKDTAEILIVINAQDIEKNKVRGDIGITYDVEVLRLIDNFRDKGMYVGSVALTQYNNQPSAKAFERKINDKGIKVYHHYYIEGYPANLDKIVSEDGYGKNDYIETSRSLVVVTAPGPGSGKMATCMSQLYHEHKRGITAGYAKYETFPVWNLPLKHPVNIAYEAATADLNDINMIDPFHFEYYGEPAVNYNRDVENFPVLNTMLEMILGKSPYKSPTDMGVNMVGYGIINNDAVEEAGKQEVIRRYFSALCDVKKGVGTTETATKIEYLLKKLGISPLDRSVVAPARAKTELTGEPAVAIELNDGRIITGKTGKLLGASAGALLNALKALGQIPDELELISPTLIEPIQDLKINHLGSVNKKLHANEVLIALSVCAVTDKTAKLAMEQLGKLKNCELHATVILSPADENVFKKLGLRLSYEPIRQREILYTK